MPLPSLTCPSDFSLWNGNMGLKFKEKPETTSALSEEIHITNKMNDYYNLKLMT